jgi:hypothetical protein
MSETPEAKAPALPEIQARLNEVAQLLRQPGSLDPHARQALTDLVDGLGKVLREGALPSPQVASLAHDTAHLAESLHPHPNTGVLGSARDRLEQTLFEVEVHHPVVAGLARRLLDALANIGI